MTTEEQKKMIAGDINLDEEEQLDVDVDNVYMRNTLEEVTDEFNIIGRLVNEMIKEKKVDEYEVTLDNMRIAIGRLEEKLLGINKNY